MWYLVFASYANAMVVKFRTIVLIVPAHLATPEQLGQLFYTGSHAILTVKSVATLPFFGMLLLTIFCSFTVRADIFFAAPDGLPSGNGSKLNPWDLTTALSRTDAIRPGDTLYLRGGTYRGGFTCKLQGTAERSITIRQFEGERATIDCQAADGDTTFTVDGDWLVFWGFEMTCSDPKRHTKMEGSWPSDIRRGGFSCRTSHVKFINLVLHDLGGGIGWWSDGEAGEIYGCLIFANGWQGPDRPHGHAIYGQNERGTKRIADNIIFNQFGYGIHCYGSDKGHLRGFKIEGNILFNNGALGAKAHTCANILIGGGSPVSRTWVTQNVSWHHGTTARFGYPWGPDNLDIAITDNYFVGSVAVERFEQLRFSHNQLIGSNLVEYKAAKKPALLQSDWDENSFWQTENNRRPFMIWEGERSTQFTYQDWLRYTDADSRSQFADSKLNAVKIFLRKNQYEPGRANIAVFNWAKAKALEIDLSPVLKIGQRFHIVSAQNYFGTPLVEGTFTGKRVLLPMQPTKKHHPIGWPVPLPDTEPLFGAFVVLPQN